MLDIDINKILTKTEGKEDFKKILDILPKDLSPDTIDWFSGIDIVTSTFVWETIIGIEKWLVDDKAPDIGGVVDLASLYIAAGQTPPRQHMFVIFVREGINWALSFYLVLLNIYRILWAKDNLATGKTFSKDDMEECAKKTATTMKKIFLGDFNDVTKAISTGIATARKETI